MAYSKVYQTVVAGRTREDDLGFFKYNKVATPSGARYQAPVGGKSQPTIQQDFMGTEDVGKNTNRDTAALDTYLSNKYNTSGV